ncbi:MAG TPA: hypothetical protein VIA81_06860 [Acidimicrobiia bacterium]|jgi:hypothetical protein
MQATMPQDVVEALFIVAITGGIFGVIGGFLGSKRRLLGSILLGMIGGISLSSIVRIAGYDPVFEVQEGFSLLYAAIGGLVLGYAVGRSTA